MAGKRKYDLVKSRSKMGAFHQTFQACWDAIPKRCISALTSADLLALVGAMKAQHQHGAHHATQEIISQGRVYGNGGYYELGPFVPWCDEEPGDA